MAGNQITVSSARRSNRAKGSDKAEMGACEACRTPMLLASVPRHFETACEMNPNRQWHKCHKCPRGFTRKDALKRHLAAPQACSGSKQAATSPESGASPGPSRPARTRTSRRTVPYAPSPASSSSSSSSRRRRRGRYSSGSPESAISSATSASPPVPFITGLAPVEEFQNRTRPSPIINASAFGRNPQPASNPIGPVAQSSAGMGQHNRYFENPHFLIPAEGFSQISQVPPLPYYLHTSLEPHINATLPQTVPGVHFDDSWGASSLTEALLINPVPQPHGDLGAAFYGASAGLAAQNQGYSQTVDESQFTPASYYYPLSTQEQPALVFQEPVYAQHDYPGEQVAFNVQSPSGSLQYSHVTDDNYGLSVEPQCLWEAGPDAMTFNNTLGDLTSGSSGFILY